MSFYQKITINKPPYKYEKGDKVYYLTGNFFFNKNYWIVNEVCTKCKRWLLPHFENLPKLERVKFDFVFRSDKVTFDLDNKGYFWEKLIFDILKTPSEKQLRNAHLKGKDIITANVLNDDNVKYITEINKRFEKGGNQIIIEIRGELMDEQQELF